jgi:signal transduction histidine kinase
MTEPTRRPAELTAYLSHELRNALACIQQFGNILLDGLAGELSSEQRQYVGIMVENASNIRRVLDSALDGNPSPLDECKNKSERASGLEI